MQHLFIVLLHITLYANPPMALIPKVPIVIILQCTVLT